MTEATTEKVLGEEEFLLIAENIYTNIRKSADLKPDGKKATLEVLGGIIESVKAHGIKKHGLTKKKKQIALTVFERFSNDETLSEDEKAVYHALLVMTWEGIRQA